MRMATNSALCTLYIIHYHQILAAIEKTAVNVQLALGPTRHLMSPDLSRSVGH
jgi:hypothetical protein